MPNFAQRMLDMEPTAKIIRGLFNAMSDADTISFGGGAPAKEGLPVDIVREICNDVLTTEKRGMEALQYGSVLGVLDLRQAVADVLLAPKGMQASVDELLIVNGGLETMNLLCQVYINPGDVILVESPTFVHCVEIFEMFQAKCIAVECDADGMQMEDLEEKIQQYHPKMVYVIPTFQNPTGKTLPTERRKKMAELGSQYDVIILEDDPYQELRYSGEVLPPIKCFDQTGHTVYANSFSKIFSPGSRLGYVYADKEIIIRLFDAKTATNSHTSTLAQVICAEFFRRGYYPEHLKKICAIHRERRDAMMACIEKYFPEGTKKVYPDGGLFTWVELPGKINTTELLKEANERKVHYIAGEGFFVEGNGKGQNCMRISFGNVTPEQIEIGMKRLGDLICSK
ncbi:MAG TPA: PLP-dependent aminotransferase family protein [Candidatus Anaerotignum merdipullorum]|nr:PLP-dependent aminotransferase family protein [Candidatus Anaerotignum merdipullorum]